MDPEAMSIFVDQAAAEAERILGPAANAALLDRYARDAVLDLWLARPAVTVATAELARRRLREAIDW